MNSGSLIAVERNSYSVNSRFIGEIVKARVFAEHLEIWYGGSAFTSTARLIAHRLRGSRADRSWPANFGDGDIDDLRHLLTPLQKTLERFRISDGLLARRAGQQQPERILNTRFSLPGGQLQYLQISPLTAVGHELL